MRLVVCGLGSAGSRHLEIALRQRESGEVPWTDVEAVSTGRSTIPREGRADPDRLWTSIAQAVSSGEPGALVVANPTSMHLESAQTAVGSGWHVLVEKPTHTSTDGLLDLAAQAESRGLVVSTAQNLRYHPEMVRLKQLVVEVSLGAPVLAQAYFGAYLPDWHPWEDYRSSYAARRALGGGVLLTSNHEADAFRWLLGPVRDSSVHVADHHPLGTEVDESATFTFVHTSGVLASAMVSLAERPSRRVFHVAFTGGSLTIDFLGGTTVEAAEDQPADLRRWDPAGAWGHSYEAVLSDFHACAIAGVAAVPLGESYDVLAALKV